MSKILRRGSAAALAVGLAGAVLVPTPASAIEASLGKKWFSPKYSKSYCFYSKPLKKAYKVRISGKLRYMRHAYKFNKGVRVVFKSPRLVNPTISMTTWTKCSKGKRTKVSKAKLDQIWYAWKCDTKVSVFAGFPWSVGVGATKSCGRTKKANRSTHYGKGSSYTQYNSGAPVKWNWGQDGKRIDKGGKICFHADAAATGWVGTRSDTVNRPINVCVTASYAK